MSTQWTPGVLVIGRDRMFYSGLAGNSGKPRNFGAHTLYLAPSDPFRIAYEDGKWTECEVALVAPFQTHRLMASAGVIHDIGFEPESLSPDAVTRLCEIVGDPKQRSALLNRVRAAPDNLAQHLPHDGLSTQDFDRLFLNEGLEARQVDPRIRRVLETMCDDALDSVVSADEHAAQIGLSQSRFLFLFKQNTGLSFRSLRMWKRARRFLDHANGSNSLTDVALDLGYPDSSHFSHSIRRTYGLKPRSIREGSRNLKVYAGANYTLAPDVLAG